MKEPALLILILSTTLFAASKRERQEAIELMSRASQLSAVQGTGLPPLHLYVTLKLGGLVSGPSEGRYLWITGPGEKWRREIKVSTYVDIAVGDGEKTWRKRNLGFTPKSASWTELLVANHGRLFVLEGEKLERVYGRSGRRCIDLRRDEDMRVLCFDAQGLLTSVSYPNEGATYTYDQYEAFENRLFPRILRVTSHGKVVVDAKVDELAVDPAPYAGLFAAPPGTAALAGCVNPIPGRLIWRAEPEYPYIARSQHRLGSVTLSVQIDREGRVRQTLVIGTAGTDLDVAAANAVKQWRYTPFTCGKTPVESETEVTINFLRDPNSQKNPPWVERGLRH
jgi:TonB family protein